MKHKVKLVWNAFRYDFNSNKLEVFNVIRDDLIKDIEKAYKKKTLKTIQDLKSIIGSWATYNYWSRAEYEVLISDLFEGTSKKVDVYKQLEINLDRLTEYIAREMQLF